VRVENGLAELDQPGCSEEAARSTFTSLLARIPASLSAGLIAVGVPQSTAFAIAITQRLSTFYLPPIWGYVSLHWLTRKGYV
jgi:MFS superfamily sulfate permease-like transporter